MKPSRLAWLVVAVLAFLGGVLAADPSPSPSPSRETPRTNDRRWNIRTEVLDVVMPQEKALAWLPALQDENKIADAVAAVLDATKKKEVTLAGYPVVWAKDGEMMTSETTDERIYPTQFAPPPDEPGSHFKGSPPTAETVEMAFPTAFEKRNVGVRLEVNTQVLDGGKSIGLACQVQHVYLLDWDNYESTRSKTGGVVTVKQPHFFVAKDSFSATLKNGAYVLVGFHNLSVPEGAVELFILHVTATGPMN